MVSIAWPLFPSVFTTLHFTLYIQTLIITITATYHPISQTDIYIFFPVDILICAYRFALLSPVLPSLPSFTSPIHLPVS